MVDKCISGIFSRGVCGAHYYFIQRMVRKRKATWEMFVEKGICLNPREYSEYNEMGRGSNNKKMVLIIDMMMRKGL